jgi:hypothetical protein
MNGRRSRVLTRGARTCLWLVLLGVPGCVSSEDAGAGEVCATYACINAAVLSGVVEVPTETTQLRVKYCSEQGCVDGTVDIAGLGSSAACTGEALPAWGDSVCFTRSMDGAVQVQAQLTRQDDQSLPPDGESYTLEIFDAESGESLLEETRAADYETTRRDNCHWCWRAELSL